MNPNGDLRDLLASLPKHPEITEKERAGRVGIPPGTKLRNGDYILSQEIGCGSFGLLYAAMDSRIGQSLAVKQFFPIGCELAAEGDFTLRPKPGKDIDIGVLHSQFQEEFRVLERFERPGIVKVYDLFEESGGVFLVMELLQGATLEDILIRHGSLEEPLALWLIRRLLQTLENIHLSGLVHGDIKPENVFLANDGQVILLDFGAVNHYLSRDLSAPRFLTPGYAPPEQYQTKSVPDPSSDLYAVGATLYQLLTGAPPPDAMQRVQGTRLPAPTRHGVNVSSSTVSALGRTLALAREKRPASAHDLLGLLPESGIVNIQSKSIWDRLSCLEGHKHGICRLQLTSDGKFLASADKGGQVRLWSLEQERCVGVMEFEKEIVDIAIHPEDLWLAVALIGGDVQLIEFTSGRLLATLRSGTPPVSKLCFNQDGETLACALFDGRLELHNLKHKGRKKIIRAHEAPINDACFSPSGRLVALASNDRSASIWDTRSGRRIRSFDDHHRPVQAIRFSPSGRFVVSGGSDMSLRVLDVKRGDEFRRLKGHEAMVWDLVYLPDQHYVLSCSADRTVRCWDMKSFREIGHIQLSDAWLCSMAFCPTTSMLYIGGVDKMIHRLRLRLGAENFGGW